MALNTCFTVKWHILDITVFGFQSTEMERLHKPPPGSCQLFPSSTKSKTKDKDEDYFPDTSDSEGDDAVLMHRSNPDVLMHRSDPESNDSHPDPERNLPTPENTDSDLEELLAETQKYPCPPQPKKSKVQKGISSQLSDLLAETQPSPKTSSQKKKGPARKRIRLAKSCPFAGCKKEAVNVKRHLMRFHHIPEEATKEIIARKAKVLRPSKAKRPRPLLKCDYCLQHVQRLDNHLVTVHKMSKAEGKISFKEARRELKEKEIGAMPAGTDSDGEPTKESKHHSDLTSSDDDNDNECISLHSEDIGPVYEIPKKRHNAMLSDKDYLLKGFKKWLESMAGSKRSVRTSEAYVGKAARIIDSLGGELLQLRHYEQIAMHDGLLQQLADEGVKPTTIKVYLCALKALFEYLMILELDEFPEAFLTRGMKMCLNYMSGLKTDIRKQKQLVKEQDSDIVEELIPKMKLYMKSERMREAVKVLGSVKSAPTIQQYSQVRGHCIISALLGSGHRAGAVLNATMREFEASKQIKEDAFVMKVEKHKTFGLHGMARVNMNGVLYNHLSLFAEMRNKFLRERGSNDDGWLFCNFEGGKLSRTGLTRALRQVLDDKTVTATKIRKGIVVMVCSYLLYFHVHILIFIYALMSPSISLSS